MALLQNSKAVPQVLKSKDDRISIQITKDVVSKAIYPHCDFSLIDMPISEVVAAELFTKLYKSQRNNHCTLVFSRQPRKTRLQAIANILEAESVGFKFHDQISIVSQEPYKSVPSNLTPVGEVAFLMTKQADVNKDATSWFNPEFGNATNVWDVTPQEDESISTTVSRHFCLEIGYLIANCASPLICRRFLVLQTLEPGHVEFAVKANMALHGITVDELSAKRILRYYNSKFCS